MKKNEIFTEIALATYNGEKYLPDFLESIEKQTHKNWRIIAQDDGSTDSTIEILRNFSQKNDGKLLLYQNKENLGVITNFSSLLEKTNSEFVFLADQDDIWHPQKIEIFLKNCEKLENEKPLLLHSDLFVVNEKAEMISDSFFTYSRIPKHWSQSFTSLLVENSVTGCAAMVNQSLLKMALPIPEGAIMHDWWLALVASAMGEILFIEKPLVYYRQHGKNEIGAKKFSVKTILEKAIKGKKRRESVRNTQTQAKYFLDIFSSRMKNEEKESANLFSSMQSSSIKEKIIAYKKYQIKKSNPLRTIGLYLSL